jgi:hypothetical protein
MRCAKCGQAYDVPGVIAVRLPNSIATCDCGEWLSGSKAALLARLMDPEDIKEIDMKPYKVDRGGDTPPPSSAVDPHEAQTLGRPRSIPRPVLICIGGPLNGQEFEIPSSGLVVGREGHVRVPDEFLSRRHFEVGPDPDGTIRVRDLGSRNGTFLNTLPAQNTKVHSGDEIRAGVNRFRIEQR